MDWSGLVNPQPKPVMGSAPPVMQLPPVQFPPPPEQEQKQSGIGSGISSIGNTVIDQIQQSKARKNLDATKQTDTPPQLPKIPMQWDFPQGSMSA